MKYEEIMKLLDAGYTKDEIMAMSNENDTGAENGAGDETGAGDENGTGAENESLNKSVDISAITDALGEIKDTFDSFKKEMIAMNIMNSRIEDSEQSADDILANIINPFENK